MKKVVLALLFVLGISSLLFAQTATISGTVTDPAGAVLPNAKVTVTNTATGLVRTAETSASGTFSIPNLPVGNYDVAVEAQGFKLAKSSNVVLQVAGVASVNFKLEVGAVSQSVEVAADAVAPVELDSSQVSNVVSNTQIENLPMLTRDPYSLVLLSPGTVQTNSSLGGFSVNGSRERNNNFMLDGVDNNDTSVPGGASGVASLSPEATQEFRVITNNFSAQYGRNDGAIIDVVTKSGTNRFHGEGHWFGRYDRFGARDWFNRPVDTTGKAVKKHPYVRNIFGASFGGPILKDKTFFFFNAELQRFRTTTATGNIVPTAAFKSGVFTYRGANYDFTSADGENNLTGMTVDPTVAQILSLYPTPNAEAVDDVRGYYRFGTASILDANTYTGKIDHRFSDKHNLSARYVYAEAKDPNGLGITLPGISQGGYNANSQNVNTVLTSVLSSTLINEFKAGFNRNAPYFNCPAETYDIFGVDRFGKGRDFDFSGIADFGCSTLGHSNGQGRLTGTWSFADNMTWVKGSHSLKFGGEYRQVWDDGLTAFGQRETINFAWGPDYRAMAGVPSNYTVQNTAWSLVGGVRTQYISQYFNTDGERVASDFRQFRQREYGFYFQDDWKVRSNLTLNLGLRYQFNGIPYEVNNLLTSLFADPKGAAPFTFEEVGPGARKMYKNDWTNIEPRIGFAWDPFSKGKTSLRGSFGIFHDRVFSNLFGNSRGNPPFQQDIQDRNAINQETGEPVWGIATPGQLEFLPDATTSLVVENGQFLFPVLIDENLKMPRSMKWSFGVQHELMNNLTMEVNYVGSKGDRILRVVDGNPPNTANIMKMLPILANYGITGDDFAYGNAYYWYGVGEELGLDYEPVGNSAFFGAALNKSISHANYNSLQAKVTKRMSRGFQIEGAYTWAHSIDDASDPLAPGSGISNWPVNSWDLAQERGNSDFDVRHRAVINYTYELPFGKGKSLVSSGIFGRVLEGWSISGINTFQTGLPYEVWGITDTQFSGLGSRADLVGDPFFVANRKREQTGLNIDAFADPTYGRAGTVGRNNYYGPSFNSWDLVFGKKTTITEGTKLELRTEFFNVLNHANFNRPGAYIGNPGTFGMSLSQTGRPDGTTGARQLQFGAKLEF